MLNILCRLSVPSISPEQMDLKEISRFTSYKQELGNSSISLLVREWDNLDVEDHSLGTCCDFFSKLLTGRKTENNKGESRYSTRSIVLINSTRVTDRIQTCAISNSDSKPNVLESSAIGIP
ncbi:hypothetical protein J6590_058616 [Homalodisca vitripennis]|nr:hypothetical protein J6590_058616 [Homalodisca vitripennis]